MNKYDYLRAMGIDVWQEKTAISTQASDGSTESWDALQQQVSACTLCSLHQSRKHVVFGRGNPKADILFIGEAPGAQEDQQGKPFIGRAGQLLTNMLAAIDVQRDDVFIANILKCRPPNNRDPKPEEVALCTRYLTAQIQHIQPKVIVALGRIAAHFLLNTATPLGKMRNREYHYGEQQIPLMVTYHPAYLLRSPTEKRKSWQDLLRLQKYL